MVEIYGPEASGKTTLALHCVAEAQKRGGTAVYIDVEHALDASYVAALGVDVKSLLIAQPDSGEQALSVADTFIRSSSVDIVVIDSVAALVPKAELEVGPSAEATREWDPDSIQKGGARRPPLSVSLFSPLPLSSAPSACARG